ncbi:hypothetical protein SISSUDRAFT_443362 [Sistotremastrum suecicum HHB10207 ss-3]|uniref:Uncharacterized protein n=1 Tax=Sistotremastrum suecicum HHB10207 ss-3 TaxID=1314776 RepID=A0A165YD02_9AGAM|nr:hypothetical protein SISSUDRAFT_443362 [Sistotremastrum suecicum HHB10207 ss-3]
MPRYDRHRAQTVGRTSLLNTGASQAISQGILLLRYCPPPSPPHERQYRRIPLFKY